MTKKEKIDSCLILDYVYFIIDDWDVTSTIMLQHSITLHQIKVIPIKMIDQRQI